MHNFFEIHEIKTKFVEASRFFLQPMPLITQMYKESNEYDYKELSAIKNYFGEKTGFYYAFISFYTNWLITPAILSFALTVYQNTIEVDTTLSSIYAILICAWVTLFIERWKRKASEIAFKWGVILDRE